MSSGIEAKLSDKIMILCNTHKIQFATYILMWVMAGHKQASNIMSLAAQNQTPTKNNRTSKFTLTSNIKITAFKQNCSANSIIPYQTACLPNLFHSISLKFHVPSHYATPCSTFNKTQSQLWTSLSFILVKQSSWLSKVYVIFL